MAAICCMDIASGVIFGVDYGRFNDAALKYNANSVNSGEIYPMAATLIAGGVAAISMMIISFKGFVLWFINFGLLVYLLMRAIRIATDKDGVVSAGGGQWVSSSPTYVGWLAGVVFFDSINFRHCL